MTTQIDYEWEDYDEYDSPSDNSFLLDETELSNDEIDLKIKKSVLYVKSQAIHKRKIFVPVFKDINKIVNNLEGVNYTNLKSSIVEVENKVEKIIERPKFLNWVKKEDISISNENSTETETETETEDESEEESEDDKEESESEDEDGSDSSSDDDHFYKCMTKNIKVNTKPSLKNIVVPNKTQNFTNLNDTQNNWIQAKNKNNKQENTLQKTKMCKISDCMKGKNCLYAHSFEELNIKKCLFQEKCRNVEIKNGILCNKNEDNICRYIHQNETIDNYKIRLGFLEKIDTSKKTLERCEVFSILTNKIKIQTELKFTKLCKFFKENKECPHQDNCRFAHSLSQLKVSNCLFNDKCRLVKIENNKLCNVSKTKVCEHLHEGKETIENYCLRISIFDSKVDKELSIKKICL